MRQHVGTTSDSSFHCMSTFATPGAFSPSAALVRITVRVRPDQRSHAMTIAQTIGLFLAGVAVGVCAIHRRTRKRQILFFGENGKPAAGCATNWCSRSQAVSGPSHASSCRRLNGFHAHCPIATTDTV